MSPEREHVLKQIARRYAKSLIDSTEVISAFQHAGIAEDDHDVIENELYRIADKITALPSRPTAEEIVAEYELPD